MKELRVLFIKEIYPGRGKTWLTQAEDFVKSATC